MTNLTIEKAQLYKLIGKKLPDQVLAQKMAMLGTDVGEITETTITVEIFPNRPDLLSVQGFARALRAFLGIKPGMQKYTTTKGKAVVTIEPNMKVVRPFTACGIARKLKLDAIKIKTLIDLQEKLHGTYGRKRKRIAMGLYPLNEVSLPIKFQSRPPNEIVFTPLDASGPMPAMQILKDHPKGKEFGDLLYGLREFPVFVDDAGRIMSLVPIVNSAITGRLTEETKDVFIEVSGCD